MYIHVRIAGRMCRQRHNVHPHPLLPTRSKMSKKHKSSRQRAPKGKRMPPNRLGCYAWDHKDQVRSVCFSPDGSMLATGMIKQRNNEYTISKSKTKIHEWDHNGFVNSVCFSPDGSMLATGGGAKKTTIYDLKSMTKIHAWDHNTIWVRSVCFSPDGSMLATGDTKQTKQRYTISKCSDMRLWHGI